MSCQAQHVSCNLLQHVRSPSITSCRVVSCFVRVNTSANPFPCDTASYHDCHALTCLRNIFQPCRVMKAVSRGTTRRTTLCFNSPAFANVSWACRVEVDHGSCVLGFVMSPYGGHAIYQRQSQKIDESDETFRRHRDTKERSHLTVMYLYVKMGERGVWRTLFSGGGGGPRCKSALWQGPVCPLRVHHRSLGVLAISLPPAFGLLAAVNDPLGDVGETSKPIGRERRPCRIHLAKIVVVTHAVPHTLHADVRHHVCGVAIRA